VKIFVNRTTETRALDRALVAHGSGDHRESSTRIRERGVRNSAALRCGSAY
jgi:hypothetical protein